MRSVSRSGCRQARSRAKISRKSRPTSIKRSHPYEKPKRELMQAAAALGVADSFNKSPRQLVADFYKRDPKGDIDSIYAKLLKDAPAVKQAEATLLQRAEEPGRCRAESALFQSRCGNRWRRYAPQCESRQQRRRRPKPDGGPLDRPKSGSTPTSKKRNWRISASGNR